MTTSPFNTCKQLVRASCLKYYLVEDVLFFFFLNSPNIAQIWWGQQAIMGVLSVEVEHIVCHPLSISHSSWYRSDLEHNLSQQSDRSREWWAFTTIPPQLITRKQENVAERRENSHNSCSTKNHCNAL